MRHCLITGMASTSPTVPAARMRSAKWNGSSGSMASVRADLAQGVDHQRDRVFVFLPRADLDRNGQIGFERADLEVRADHDRRAAGASSIETRRSLWPQGSPVK
jgi:hypothetical protein